MNMLKVMPELDYGELLFITRLLKNCPNTPDPDRDLVSLTEKVVVRNTYENWLRKSYRLDFEIVLRLARLIEKLNKER